MPLSKDDVSAIETVAHYTHDEDQAYLMLYGGQRAGWFPSSCCTKSHGMRLPSDDLRPRRAPANLIPCQAAAVLATLTVFLRWPTGEGVFETIPIEADYTVGDMKLWLNFHKVRSLRRAASGSTRHVEP